MRVPLQVNIICKDPIGGYPLTVRDARAGVER